MRTGYEGKNEAQQPLTRCAHAHSTSPAGGRAEEPEPPRAHFSRSREKSSRQRRPDEGKAPRQPFTRPREARAEFSRKQRSKKSALPATLLRGRKTDALAHIRLVTGGKRDTEHHQHDNPFERLPETADCPPQMFGPSDAFKQQLLSRHAS